MALERVLHGEDASEPISQKILESTPFAPGPPTIGFNICGKVCIEEREKKRRCINSLKKLFDGSSGIPFRGPLPVLTIPDEPKQVEPEYPFLLISHSPLLSPSPSYTYLP